MSFRKLRRYFVVFFCFVALHLLFQQVFQQGVPESTGGDKEVDLLLHQLRTSFESSSVWSFRNVDQKCNLESIGRMRNVYFETIFRRIGWWFDRSGIAERKKEWKAFVVSELAKESLLSSNSSYRGVSISVYPKAMKLAFITISFIRNLGSEIPVEIWHNNELQERHVHLLQNLPNVMVKNLHDYLPKEYQDLSGYSLKGNMLLYSEFDEILMLDVDNLPVKNVDILFELPAFKETGAVFWPDFWKTSPSNPIYEVLELQCNDEYEQESGQLLVNKKHPGVNLAIKLAAYFQRNQEFYFRLVFGDKDTFRFAFRALGVNYHMVRANLAALGNLDGNRFCGSCMVQHLPISEVRQNGSNTLVQPEIMFVHANLMKERTDFASVFCIPDIELQAYSISGSRLRSRCPSRNFLDLEKNLYTISACK
jgi:hypothetical protein